MGIRKERLRRKIADGSYDIIHLETSSDVVLLSDGSGLLEDELLKVKPIANGGTEASTGSGAMYNLINGCDLLEQAADGDYLIVLDVSEQTCKKIAVSDLVDFVGGGSNPNWPNKNDLTLGNTITWAGKQWIVAHTTSTEVYLTLAELSGKSTWNNLQSTCTSWNNSNLNDDQRACLKSITAGNTSGKVFVATEVQMTGGFSYFNSNSRRNVGDYYWTSTEVSTYPYNAYSVSSNGYIDYFGDSKSTPNGFRPSICIDLTLYN